MSSHGSRNEDDNESEAVDREVQKVRSFDPADIAARWVSMSTQQSNNLSADAALSGNPFLAPAEQDQLAMDHSNPSVDSLLQSFRNTARVPDTIGGDNGGISSDADYRSENDATLRSGNRASQPPVAAATMHLSDLFAPPSARMSTRHGLGDLDLKQNKLGDPLSGQTDAATSTGATLSVADPALSPIHPAPHSASSISLPPSPSVSQPVEPASRHDRLASWGLSGIQVPAAAAAPATAPASDVGIGINDSDPLLAPSQVARRSSIALADILQASPYETEAETYILKAIEKRARPRFNTADSSVWSMADQAAHEFEDTQTDLLQGESFMPATPIGQYVQAPIDDDDDALQDQNMPVIENLAIPAINSSRQSSVASNSNPQQRERNPLLVKRPSRVLKRQVSVQDHLSGLTSAMKAMDGYGNETRSQDSDLASDKAEQARKDETPAARAHRRHGSADQFASNAIRLLEHSDPENQIESTPTSAGKGHRRWGTIDNSLSILEEDDASELSQDSGQENNDSPKKALGNDGSDHGKVEGVLPRKATRRHPSRRRRNILTETNNIIKEDLAIWNKFLRTRRLSAWRYLKLALCYVILPATAVSAILFYAGRNPPTGRGIDNGAAASASWWILFMCVRQVVTLLLALGTQAIVIDFLGLETKILLRLLGPVLSLLIVQSKGWPCIVMFWAVFDFILLHGDWSLAHHWGYFQSYVDLFNAQNPSGQIVDSRWNQVILGTAIGVSGVTSIKRFLIGLYQGRQLFTQYGHQLAKLMNKMLLISQVAGLAKDIERAASSPDQIFTWNDEALRGLAFSELDDADDDSVSLSRKDALKGALARPGTQHLQQLLDEWEEPDVDKQSDNDEDVTIAAVLKFRKALFFIQKEYPFSYSFGPASSREECVASAQSVYERLLLHKHPGGRLHFETIALLALDLKGRLDTEKARKLIKLFRPDRDGSLELIDFVKSIDAIYKRYRLLLASIANTNAIDRASERIFNFGFYILVIVVVTTVWGFDPIAIFLSLSSIVLGFAFMIGKASASYFDGVLFILVRRPYGIGDRIHVSNIEGETNINGSLGWVVENITLFETTAVWTPTRERCSLANGSLAQSRIINGARSPQAQFLIPFKFPISTPYDKILIFKAAIEEYLKARPREWLMMTGFRAAKIAPELGFIEYMMHVLHRQSWQEHNALQDSKANFQSYCLEVSNQLGMHYRAPPLPVDLRHPEQVPAERDLSDIDSSTRIEGFRSLAMTQHRIGWVGN